MDSHHGVKEESQINTLRFDGQLEIIPISIECPWAFQCGNTNACLISMAEQPLFNRSLRGFIEELDGSVAEFKKK